MRCREGAVEVIEVTTDRYGVPISGHCTLASDQSRSWMLLAGIEELALYARSTDRQPADIAVHASLLL
jgi:hypothetical protein